MLTGCTNDAQQMESLCTGFEASWNGLAVEAHERAEAAALSARLKDTSKTWNDLADLGGPDDVTGVVRNASSHLLSAWNASSQAERHSQVTSLRNAAGYLSLQCEKSDHAIDLQPLSLP